jgi:aminopeptidase N
MKYARNWVKLLLVFVWIPFSLGFAEDEIVRQGCYKTAGFFAPPDAQGISRQYAEDREVVVTHLKVDVTPDYKAREISATTTVRCKVLGRSFQEVRFDAINLRIRSLKSNAKVLAWRSTTDELVITFEQPLASGREFEVAVEYTASPAKGLYFRTPEMGYLPGDDHLFTQGESIEARHWYPCLDTPNQLFTSEIICRLPKGMTSISNGRLVSQKEDPKTGLVTFHWSQEQPHANYLVTLVAGYLKSVETQHGDLPLAFFTPPSEIAQAQSSFRDTRDIMDFFEKEIGVRYPWNKYYQVCVNDFVAGGMENTSATTLTDSTLFSEETENLHDSAGLVAHELAHQWFGDLVTCKDWSHLWLNEGFATYYEALYDGYKNGKDAFLFEMHQRIKQLIGIDNSGQPIVRRTFAVPEEMFDTLAYTKGSWILHMLRAELGEELYRRCVKTFLERHRHGSVVTEDFRKVIEELSHRNFDRFFDQWLYHAQYPALEVTYRWDELSRMAGISVRQTHEVNDKVLLFQVPLKVRFMVDGKAIDKTVYITRKEEDFHFVLPAAPTVVRLDPEVNLLAKISFTPSMDMIFRQLEDPNDLVGRAIALERLSGMKDRDTVARLKKVLNEDSFHAMRTEASRMLRAIHDDAALDALLASMDQSDARVRMQVIIDIGMFYDEHAYAAGLKLLDAEKNPGIAAQALRDLAAYAKPEIKERILKCLQSSSYHDVLASAAIAAMRSQDDPEYIPVLMKFLAGKTNEPGSRAFMAGMEPLGYLARNETDKTLIREFLVAQLGHDRKRVRAAALSGLGKLGDTRALAAVEKFTSGQRRDAERQAAERAAGELRAYRRPADDIKGIRQEVLELQKSDRELREEIEKLKKELDKARSPLPVARTGATGKQPSGKAAEGQPSLNSPKASK